MAANRCDDDDGTTNGCQQHLASCNISSRRHHDDRHRHRSLACTTKRWLVSTAIIIMTLTAPDTTNLMHGAYAKPSVRPFVGRQRSGKRVNQKDAAEGGLTLGDLDQMMQNEKEVKNAILRPNTIFGSDTTNNGHHDDRPNQQNPADSTNQENKESSSSSNPNNSNQLRKSLQRINLDLSGRVMCHVISPRDPQQHDNRVSDRESIPLCSLPKQAQRHILERIIPHVYLGANYDLDQVWYGATRWIAKCSWGPLTKSIASPPTNRVWESANHVYNKLFPSFPYPSSSQKSSWNINVEGEQSVFDHSDSTARLRLIQSPSVLSTAKNNNLQCQIPQQISIDYDSAKYHSHADNTPSASKRRMQYAPTITMNIKTPFLHRRLEVHSRKTWILQDGGDDDGNYYGGEYYGSESCVDRRLECIKEGYRGGIPRSSNLVATSAPLATSTNATPNRAWNNLGSKLSKWLENDGWMPRKVTTDLLGNLISVSEVGFGKTKSSKLDTNTFQKRALRGIIPPIHNTGIRLRISKKIDWTTLGVFPWSKNSVKGHTNGNNNGMFEALRSTHVRLELCGMYGSEDKCASAGLDVDPLDWRRTLKVTVGQEDVSVLGRR